MTNATTKTAPAVEPTGHVPRAAEQAAETIQWAGKTFREAVVQTLTGYEHLVSYFVEFEHKAAQELPFYWTKAMIDLQATFLEDISAVYAKTIRAALN